MKIRRAGAILITALLVVGSIWFFLRQEPVYRTTAFAMDTFIEITLYGRRAQAAAEDLLGRFERLEENVSLYRPDSEIASLNRRAGTGEWTPFSPDTYTLLERAKRFSLGSEKTFDLTIAPLSTLWNVMGENPHVPRDREIARALELVDADSLTLDELKRSARLEKAGQGVDLGGSAKGYAAGFVFDVMDEYGIRNGLVSLGGNVAVRGRRPDTGQAFRIGVRSPRGESGEYFGVISLDGQIMATSGDYERYFEQDGIRYHHLIDPRTGSPARGGLISVTVISEDGMLADLLSTALFVAGKEEVLAHHLDRPDYQVIAVDEEMQVYCSAALEGIFVPESDSPYRFHFLAGETEGTE